MPEPRENVEALCLARDRFAHQLPADFPIPVRGGKGRRVDAQIGEGGPPVRLATTNGGIEIRRR